MASMKYCAGVPGRHAGALTDPPVLGRELHDVFFAPRIDDIFAQAPGSYECAVRHAVTGALEELTGVEGSRQEQRFQEREVVFGEGASALEVCAESMKFGHWKAAAVHGILLDQNSANWN